MLLHTWTHFPLRLSSWHRVWRPRLQRCDTSLCAQPRETTARQMCPTMSKCNFVARRMKVQNPLSQPTLPVLRPGLPSCLPPSSLDMPSFSASSPCCERDSDSDWPREGVSEPWLRGEEERDGDSRNRRMAGWFRTAGSLLEACWHTKDSGCGSCTTVNLIVMIKKDSPLGLLSFQHWQSN